MEMYEIIKHKQTDAYNNYMQKHKGDIDFKTKEINQKESHIISVRIKINYIMKQCSLCISSIYIKTFKKYHTRHISK